MSTTTKTAAPFYQQTAEPDLTWRVWPLRAGTWSLLVIVGVILLGFIVSVLTTAYLGLIAAGVAAVAAWRFLLPVEYGIGSSGVTQKVFRRRRTIAWKDIRRCEVRPDGVLAFCHSVTIPLDLLRAVYLPWGNQQEDVLRLMRQYAGHTFEEER